MIREIERPKLKDLFSWLKPESGGGLISSLLSKVKLVGSGKGAITLILKYLTEQGKLKNKLDEIIVSDWLGYWVHCQMQPYASPVKRPSDRTKIIFVYHQYGFPQDMDKIMDFARSKNLIVIEDCAHAIASQYKGRQLGTFGDFALYSFSKWFFCFALGGVSAKACDFYDFIEKSISETPSGLTFFKDKIKFFDEWISFSKSERLKKFSNLLLNMSYAVYGQALKPGRSAVNLLKLKLEEEIKTRQRRYGYFLKQTENLGVTNHLEREGVTPFVIPLRPAEAKIDVLVSALRNKGILTGRYHFDLNRNLLSPRYAPVVWLPCHRGISDEVFSELTETVIKTIR